MTPLRPAWAAQIPAPVHGALWMVFAAATFSLMTAMIRPIAAHLHIFEIVFFRNVFSLVILGPVLFRGGLGVLRTQRLPMHLVRATCFLAGMLCWFAAIPHIALVDAMALDFTAPIFITILAATVLGERVRARRWTAVVLGFIGTLVVLRPGFQSINVAAFLILADAFVWSISATILGSLAHTESARTIVAHMFLWVTPVSLFLAIPVWQTPDLKLLLWLAVMSALSAAGHLANARAFVLTQTSVLMPFDYTRLVFVGIVGYFAFDEVPDPWTLLGAGIIVASALYIAHREGRLGDAARRRGPRAEGAQP
ncbi:MAG: DMT family transporter [Alphaproteobacteria bacterium]